ncbi:hypothetical protein [Rhizobium sp. P32RR-XVIII]|nr:hypothetical protein [Rhizobium sp. P32RR-XVIII]
MKGIVAKNQLLHLPITYANAINDPRTKVSARAFADFLVGELRS